MAYSFISARDQPELLAVTGHWRWQGFFRTKGIDLQEVLCHERQRASCIQGLPCTFVLLENRQPLGMVTLAENDLDLRPNLNPWLADLYVAPMFRGYGHGLRLIQGLEAQALKAGIDQLWLFTTGAAKLYAKAGWITVEMIERQCETITLMKRDLLCADNTGQSKTPDSIERPTPLNIQNPVATAHPQVPADASTDSQNQSSTAPES